MSLHGPKHFIHDISNDMRKVSVKPLNCQKQQIDKEVIPVINDFQDGPTSCPGNSVYVSAILSN